VQSIVNDALGLLLVFESILLFQIVYIVFQWMFIRTKEYYYYVAYMTVVSIYVFFQIGSEIEHIQSFRILEFKPYLRNTLPMLSFFFYYRFARYFVDLRKHYPAMRYWVIVLERLLLLYIIVELLFRFFNANDFIIAQFYIAISVILFVSSFIFIILFLRKKVVYSYFIVTGAFLINIGAFGTFVLLTLQNNGTTIFAGNFIAYYPYAITTILELVCFTSGLAYKAKNYVKEKNIAEMEYLTALNQKLEIQKAYNEIRDNVAIELHEKVGSILSNMEIQSSFAQKSFQSKDTKKTGIYIHNLTKLARQGHEITDELIWSINPKINTIGHLSKKVDQFCMQRLLPENIRFDILINDKVSQMKPQRDVLLKLYRIIKKTLNHNLHELPNIISIHFMAQNDEIKVSMNIDLEEDFIKKQLNNDLGNAEYVLAKGNFIIKQKITIISD